MLLSHCCCLGTFVRKITHKSTKFNPTAEMDTHYTKAVGGYDTVRVTVTFMSVHEKFGSDMWLWQSGWLQIPLLTSAKWTNRTVAAGYRLLLHAIEKNWKRRWTEQSNIFVFLYSSLLFSNPFILPFLPFCWCHSTFLFLPWTFPFHPSYFSHSI